MLIVMSWLREHVPGLPPARAVADALIRAGFEVEGVEPVGQGLAGVVVGEVLAIEEVAAKKKSVRYCQIRGLRVVGDGLGDADLAEPHAFLLGRDLLDGEHLADDDAGQALADRLDALDLEAGADERVGDGARRWQPGDVLA